jgi:hypothetical protein
MINVLSIKSVVIEGDVDEVFGFESASIMRPKAT